MLHSSGNLFFFRNDHSHGHGCSQGPMPLAVAMCRATVMHMAMIRAMAMAMVMKNWGMAISDIDRKWLSELSGQCQATEPFL